MKPKIVYVEQYRFWWKLTPAQWKALCTEGVQTGGHSLPPAASLKARPRSVGAVNYRDGDGDRSYFALRDGILIYSPLDWDKEDYQSALAELEELE